MRMKVFIERLEGYIGSIDTYIKGDGCVDTKGLRWWVHILNSQGELSDDELPYTIDCITSIETLTT